MVSTALVCIVVHHGAEAITRECVTSLYNGLICPWIIVVCNTTDDSRCLLEDIRHEHPDLMAAYEGESDAQGCDLLVVPLFGNRGFAAACNVGLRLAAQRQTIRFVWLLNNDTTVASDAAEVLLGCLEANPRALCGTSVFRADMPDVLELALGCRFNPLTTILSPCFPSTPPHMVPNTPDVDYIYGASLAFPLHVVAEVGFLDESFFLYYEEHDFCLRAKKSGYTFIWCRDSSVWHGKKEHMKHKSALTEHKHYHENRSTVLFLKKNYKVYVIPSLIFRTLCKCAVLFLRREWGLFKNYFAGVISGLLNSQK